MLELVVLKILL